LKLKNPLILSSTEFAALIGISRQAVNDAARKGHLEKVDKKFYIKSPINMNYLISKGFSLDEYLKSVSKDPEEKTELSHREMVKNQAVLNAENTELLVVSGNAKPYPKESDGQDVLEKYELEKALIRANIKKITIQNEITLGNLIDREIIRAILEKMGHSIQTNFVDLPRRESPLIVALLGVPEKEMQLSKILSEKIKISIQSFKSEIISLLESDHFEDSDILDN
jgi:hypothetical protein